jgi:hypothetical protein
LIGDTTLDMSSLFRDAFENDRSITWNKKYHEHFIGKIDKNYPIQFDGTDKFWVPLKSIDRNVKTQKT